MTHQQRKLFNVCSVESFHFRSQESLWFWSHKKVASWDLSSMESWIAHTRTPKQQQAGQTRFAPRKKSNLAHQVTWPDLIQSPGSLGFMTNPQWGENSTCKTWLERSTGGPACYFFCHRWSFIIIFQLSFHSVWKLLRIVSSLLTVPKSWARANRKIINWLKMIPNSKFRNLILKNYEEYLIYRTYFI